MAKKNFEVEKKICRTKKYRDIKKALIDHLERGGNDTPVLLDQVDCYMKQYVVKEIAYQDIQERGIYIEYRNSETQFGTKKNDSVDTQTKAMQQMLKILEMLGIKPDAGVGIDEEL